MVVDAVNDTLKVVAASLSIFSLLVVTPIVTLYLLNDWDGLIATIDRSVPVAQRETVRTLSREIDDTLAGFLRGQGTICAGFPDACITKPSTRSHDRRPRSAKARNRGPEGALFSPLRSMGI